MVDTTILSNSPYCDRTDSAQSASPRGTAIPQVALIISCNQRFGHSTRAGKLGNWSIRESNPAAHPEQMDGLPNSVLELVMPDSRVASHRWSTVQYHRGSQYRCDIEKTIDHYGM